jgi:hypothetical protein
MREKRNSSTAALHEIFLETSQGLVTGPSFGYKNVDTAGLFFRK